jgi:hypothetical protein
MTGAKTHLIRDTYDASVTQAAKDCLLMKRTGVRTMVRHIYLSIISQIHLIHSYQIYNTLFAHLTTTIVEITDYLGREQNFRRSVQLLSPWSPLTEPNLVERIARRNKTTRPTNLSNLKPEVLMILKAAKWTQDDFILAYHTVSEEMLKTDGDEKDRRLSESLAIRVFATTALKWKLDSKNRARDWISVMKAFTIEAVLIMSYREQLITACPRTRKLRNELLTFFASLTPGWPQIQTSDMDMRVIIAGCWSFPDNISISDDVPTPAVADQEAIRSQIQIQSSQKPAPKRKAATKKSPAIIVSDDDDPAPDEDEAPTQVDASAAATDTTAATKDSTTQKKLDDIQSLLSALKTIQKHKLLQCSDQDSPPGCTESIVTFAASIIASV